MIVLPKYCLNYNGMLPIKTEEEAIEYGFTFEHIRNSDNDDTCVFYWGDKPLQYEYGYKYYVIETGFFNEAYFIDSLGGSQFCSLNTKDGNEAVKTFKLNNRKSAREIIFSLPSHKQSKFNADHGDIREVDAEIVLALQNPGDRSIMSVANRKMYYKFVEDCCKFYGKSLFVKMHPWNNGEILKKLESLAEKYGCAYGKAPINIINNVNFVISYNSTIAIDCLLRNIPYVQYGLGTFFNSYGVIFSNHTFPKEIVKKDDGQQLCDFLIHKYCYYKEMDKKKFAEMLRYYAGSNEMFPMKEEFSYASNLKPNLPNHLGGHCNITHIDESTLDYLINKFNIKTMYDVGCGPGGMVNLANNKNISAIGIDGDFTLSYNNINVILHDFTSGPIILSNADLAWSCEFLEHVEEKYMDNYFSVFCKCKLVFCTFSTSRGGHHHVNVQNQEYWDNKFKSYGFVKDTESTLEIRKTSTMKRDFVRNTGTIYLNKVFI